MTDVHETDVPLPDGGTLHAYATGPEEGLPVVWHHGTPNIGSPPRPLFGEAEAYSLFYPAKLCFLDHSVLVSGDGNDNSAHFNDA